MNDVTKPASAGGDPELDMKVRDLVAQVLRRGNIFGAKKIMKAVYGKPPKAELRKERQAESGSETTGY